MDRLSRTGARTWGWEAPRLQDKILLSRNKASPDACQRDEFYLHKVSFTISKCHATILNQLFPLDKCIQSLDTLPTHITPKSFYSRLGYYFPKGHPRMYDFTAQPPVLLSTPQTRYLLLLDSQENFSNPLIIQRTSYSSTIVLLTRLAYKVKALTPKPDRGTPEAKDGGKGRGR